MVLTKMKSKRSGVFLLIGVALLALFTALSHISCIVLGPGCYRAQMAPEWLIELSKSAPWLAAFATTLVSILFAATAIYCLSGAGVIRKLPLSKPAIMIISTICIVRGLATIPLSISFPESISTFSILSGMLWFLAGLSCVSGYRLVGAEPHST